MKILKKWSIIMYPTLSILLCFVASHSSSEEYEGAIRNDLLNVM